MTPRETRILILGALYMSSVKSKDSLAINELLLSSGLPSQEISEVEWQLGHLIDSNLIRGIRCLDKNNTLSGIKEIQLLVITPPGIRYCESIGRRELEVLNSSRNAKIKEISEFLLGRIIES